MKAVNSGSLPDRVVNKAGLAAFFECSVPTVDAWIRRGCPSISRGSRGMQWQFDVLDVAKWRFGGEVGSQETEDPEMMSPKDRLDWYRGNRERDSHARDQDLLIPFDLAEKIVGAAFSDVRAELLGQHNAIASEFPEIPKDAIRWILRANRDLLTRLAETPLPDTIASALEDLAQPAETAS